MITFFPFPCLRVKPQHLVGVLAFLVTCLASADERTSSPDVTEPSVEIDTSKVQSALNRLADASGMKVARLGFHLIDAKTGDTLLARDAGKTFLPASTMKIVSTGAALYLSGPDYRFRTRIIAAGKVETGVLKGHLIIRGGGDPTLAEFGPDKVFADWLKALREQEITGVTGGVIGDARCFGYQRAADGWHYADLANYYAAGACGLSFRLNSYEIVFKPGSPGQPARFVRTNPPLPGVDFTNEMLTGSPKSGDNGYVYGAPYATRLTLRGKVPAGNRYFSIKGALPDPAKFAAQSFSTYLKKNNVSVGGEATTFREASELFPLPEKEIAISESKPLRELIKSTNFKSRNLHAESLFRTIAGKKKAGLDDATKKALEFYKARGIDTSGLKIDDGCGLSRLNQITPEQLTSILRVLNQGEHGEVFRLSLPAAGREGTLKSIGGGTIAEGKIRAKSGTIDRVKCYAGYVSAKSGREYIFAVMVNGYSGSYSPVKKGLTQVFTSMARL